MGAFPTAPPLRTAIPFADQRFLMFVLDEMAEDLEARHDDVIRLTLGKSELPPGPAVLAAMQRAAADHALASLVYPAGLPQLRRRLSREYAERHGVTVPPEQFVISTGTSTAFRNLLQLMAGPGDEVVLPLPYYPLYDFTARLAGATVRHYRIDPLTLRVDLDSLDAAMTDRTRVVIVNSPGNPLGNLVDQDQLLAMGEVMAGRGVLICDEIYGNVVFEGQRYTALQLTRQLDVAVVVTNAFSKAHRMYARRVGYAVVPDWLVQPLVVTQHHTLLTTDPIPQFGAIAALDNPGDAAEIEALYATRRDYAVRRLDGIEGLRVIPSAGGFYITLDCQGFMAASRLPTSLSLAERILRDTHVATVPGSDFGDDATIRLSFSAARFTEAIDRLAGFFATVPAGPAA